jgi:hypothetical protein
MILSVLPCDHCPRFGVRTPDAILMESETSLTQANDRAIRRALEAAGVEFTDENGGGAGVRLRKLPKPST